VVSNQVVALAVFVWCSFFFLGFLGVLLMNKVDQLLALLAEVKARVDAVLPNVVDPAKLDQAIANAQAVRDSLPPVPPVV